MIVRDTNGDWWFSPKSSTAIFGPYETRAAAERCEENYEAFVVSAPACHCIH